MISEQDYLNVRTWLEQAQRPLLVTHRRPDGDAIGALAALTLALRELGRDPQPALFEPFPQRYAYLQDLAAWRRWDEQREQLAGECDAVVILDTCAWSQLEDIAEFLPRAPRTLVIDHHPTRDPIATRPGDLQLFDETAGAVCLILAEWARASGVPITPSMASALLTGLGTDCGWFRFTNTDARLLRAAADLADAGAPINATYRAIYRQDPPAKLRLMGRMLQSLELLADGKLAVMKLRQADFAASGADRNMTDELVNEAGRLASIEGIILFTEEPTGGARVNFRSRNWLDVSVLAARFGGGGHARASGARPDGSWDQVVPRVIAAVVEALDAGT